MDPAPPTEPAKPKRKRVWKVLGWIVGILIVLAVGVYLLMIEKVKHLFAFIEVYNAIGLQPRIYAQDHDGLYPPLSSEPGRLMYSPDAFASDEIASILYSFRFPGEPDKDTEVDVASFSEDELRKLANDVVDDDNYYYLGYAVTNEIEGRAFIKAYKDTIARGGNFEEDLIVPMGQGNFGGDKLYRLREREAFMALLSKSEEEIAKFMAYAPLIILNPNKRARGYFPPPNRSKGFVYSAAGAGDHPNVPGVFPYTEEFLSALEELDRMSDNGPPERPAR